MIRDKQIIFCDNESLKFDGCQYVFANWLLQMQIRHQTHAIKVLLNGQWRIFTSQNTLPIMISMAYIRATYTLCILLLSIIVTLLNNSENIALHKYFPIDRLLAAWGVNGTHHAVVEPGISTSKIFMVSVQLFT